VRSSAVGYVVRDQGEGGTLDVYSTEDDEVSVRSLTEQNIEEYEGQATRQPSSNALGCPPFCPTIPTTFVCDGSIDWNCVANAAAGGGITCWPCRAAPSQVTCGPCLVAIILNSWNLVDDCCDGSWDPIFLIYLGIANQKNS